MLNDGVWGPSGYIPPFHTSIPFSPTNPLSSFLGSHPLLTSSQFSFLLKCWGRETPGWGPEKTCLGRSTPLLRDHEWAGAETRGPVL